jgi:hypothetical protein
MKPNPTLAAICLAFTGNLCVSRFCRRRCQAYRRRTERRSNPAANVGQTQCRVWSFTFKAHREIDPALLEGTATAEDEHVEAARAPSKQTRRTCDDQSRPAAFLDEQIWHHFYRHYR